MRRAVSRRHLLLALATTGLAGAIGGRAPGVVRRHHQRLAWLSVVGHRRSSRIVGRAYLASAPDPCDAASLQRQLLPTDPGRSSALLDDVGRLRRYVRGRIEDDFDSGRTVQVHGWVLSETEARLCALVTRL